MWELALWGFTGAACNRALVFMRANKHAKGRGWRFPEGPGGWFFLLACVLHCGIGAAVAWAAGASGLTVTPLMALGLGAYAPVVLGRAGRSALGEVLAGEDEDEGPARPGDDGGRQ